MKRQYWLDILLIAALMAGALAIRWKNATGDLWLDEADYAFAATHGVDANRWDRPIDPEDPDKIVELRHYHPPFVADMDALALRFGSDERVLRTAPVLFGGIAVALVYLTGMLLFDGQRWVSAACAAVVVITPADVRMSSHALPWSYISVWLLAAMYAMIGFTRRPHVGWLALAGAAAGGMFVTSEVFFPLALAMALAAPLAFWQSIRSQPGRRTLLVGGAAALFAFGLIAVAFYPGGMIGGTWKMLRHYTDMSHDSFPTNIGSRVYERAPKWAYLYWYWHYFRSYFLVYAAGIPGVVILAGRRALRADHAILLVFTAVLLLSAHAAHIVGPEYLGHVLPLLTLFGGLLFYAIGRWSWPAGAALAWAACALCVVRPATMTLPGMDIRARTPRWAAAARFLARRWTPGDELLAPAYGIVGRWYVLHVGRAPAQGWQVEALPTDSARLPLLTQISRGAYPFVAVGSTFTDTPTVDWRIWQMVRKWPVIWRSDEHGLGPSRLTLYQIPRGVSAKHPLGIPR